MIDFINWYAAWVFSHPVTFIACSAAGWFGGTFVTKRWGL
jgi:hypothetical protein